MDGKLRNMTSVYLSKEDKMLLLFRQGGRVVNNVWTGSAGGHFETFELNDARACVLQILFIPVLQMERRLLLLNCRSFNGFSAPTWKAFPDTLILKCQRRNSHHSGISSLYFKL